MTADRAPSARPLRAPAIPSALLGQGTFDVFPAPMSTPTFANLRQNASGKIIDAFFNGASAIGRMTPYGRLDSHDVTVTKDVVYCAERGLKLDVYRPLRPREDGACVLYIHGGGFRILSKETHWVFGIEWAAQGFTVFMPDYRLAPDHTFPAAHEDVARAYEWFVEHAPNYGCNLDKFVLAGESAGGNLALSTTISACFEREEPYAQQIFETGVVPTVANIGCGFLQVSDPYRFKRKDKLPTWLNDRILECSQGYLPQSATLDTELADPVVVLEQNIEPVRPLPPTFAPCGLADPIVGDTRRLQDALERRGVPVRALYYPGELHGFMAFIWRENARRCWAQTHDFTQKYL